MTAEHSNGERAQREQEQAWEVFRYFSAGNDQERFQEMYLGHYASRAAFGENLLRETYDADQRLAKLPRWLREYVRLDGDQVAADFERAGYYHLIEVPDNGVFVFDAVGYQLTPSSPA